MCLRLDMVGDADTKLDSLQVVGTPYSFAILISSWVSLLHELIC